MGYPCGLYGNVVMTARFSWRTLAAAAVLLLSSCGLFDPRPSESPEVSGNLDPLNFAAILNGTGEQFTRLKYEDLFIDDLSYEDLNSEKYPRNQVIQRLQQIQIQNPDILVQWEGGIPWKNTNIDTIIVSSIRYSIYVNGTHGSPPDYTGTSTFVIAKQLEWHICQWQDVPDGSQKSFFSPG